VTRVLLVEDEPIVRRLFTTILCSDGFEVRTTGLISEAKKLMGEEVFDLIVADYSLSDGTADEFYDWVKESHPEFVNKFILITGWPEKEGFPVILEKPFHIKDLEDLITKVLRIHS
jgi:DNA-binding NtrC family response regulator